MEIIIQNNNIIDILILFFCKIVDLKKYYIRLSLCFVDEDGNNNTISQYQKKY